MSVGFLPPRAPPQPPEGRRHEHEGQHRSGGATQPLPGGNRVGRVDDVGVQRPVDEGPGATARREVEPGEPERQQHAEGEGQKPPRDAANAPRAKRSRSRPRERGQPGERVVLEKVGGSEQRSGEKQPARPSRLGLIAENHDGPARGQEHQGLGVHGEHVVPDEGRAIDEVDEAGHEAAPVVRIERGGGQRREGYGQQSSEESHRDQALTQQGLSDAVVEVEQRRLVVDEVRVEEPPFPHHPGADGMGGLIHVDDLDGQRQPADQQTQGRKQQRVFERARQEGRAASAQAAPGPVSRPRKRLARRARLRAYTRKFAKRTTRRETRGRISEGGRRLTPASPLSGRILAPPASSRPVRAWVLSRPVPTSNVVATPKAREVARDGSIS